MIQHKSIIRLTTRKVITGIVVLFSMLPLQSSFAQQNILFSQYIFNTISINPAYAGFKEDWYFQAGHRSQWVGMEGVGGAPVTTQISVDGLTNTLSKNVGVGLQITADKLGAQSANSIYGNYAYRIQLDKSDMSRLSFGLGVGLTQYNTDVSLLRAVNPDDPTITFGTTNTYVPDIRFGVYYYNPKFYIGISAMDLLADPDSSSLFNWNSDSTCNIVRKTHMYLMGGALFELTDYTKFRPSIMIREDFKGPTSVDLNALFVFDNRFWLGGSYRAGYQLWKTYKGNSEAVAISNALIGIVNFQVTDRLRVGYSYDFALNSLRSWQKGSHELSIGCYISRRSKRVLSPRFF